MMPDVTNQADKEPGSLWTDAQLWVQLCSCCSERERKKEQEEKEKRDGEGEEMLHCPKIIYLDQSVNIANTCIFSCHVKPNRLCQCISKCSFFSYSVLLFLFLSHLLCLSSSLLWGPGLLNTLARYPVLTGALAQIQPS